MATNAKEMLGKTPTAESATSELAKGNMVGVTIGSIVGLVFAITKKYNVILSVFIGGLAGSLITKKFLKKD